VSLQFANADGGTGNDTMGVDGAIAESNLRGGPGADTLNGAPQTTDYVDYRGSAVPVHVDLAAGSGGSAGEDRLTSIEGASGGDGPDFISGTPGENFLNGGAGGDLISGGGGPDIVDGDRGNDTLFGGQDRDDVVGGRGRDLLFGGEGDDVLMASDGKGRRDSADTVGCGPGSDVVGAVRPRHARVRDSDLLTTDCEELDLGLPAAVLLGTHPLSASALTVGLECEVRGGCLTRVLVKEGPRFVASARRRIRRGQIRAPLSPAGRQLAARRVMVPVLVRIGIGSRSSAFRLLLPPPA
jgi:Ca2+-binding RTX toxin-like protein